MAKIATLNARRETLNVKNAAANVQTKAAQCASSVKSEIMNASNKTAMNAMNATSNAANDRSGMIVRMIVLIAMNAVLPAVTIAMATIVKKTRNATTIAIIIVAIKDAMTGIEIVIALMASELRSATARIMAKIAHCHHLKRNHRHASKITTATNHRHETMRNFRNVKN